MTGLLYQQAIDQGGEKLLKAGKADLLPHHCLKKALSLFPGSLDHGLHRPVIVIAPYMT